MIPVLLDCWPDAPLTPQDERAIQQWCADEAERERRLRSICPHRVYRAAMVERRQLGGLRADQGHESRAVHVAPGV